MSDNELAAFFGLVISLTIAVSVVARTWLKYQQLKRQGTPAALPPAVDDRLLRIENAVDAIAIEVERISEGQRFTTQLLSDRAGAAAPEAGAPEARAPEAVRPRGQAGQGGRALAGPGERGA
jgi:hypothetical protein